MMAKLNFQQQLLQSPLSRDPFEILLNMLIWNIFYYDHVENSCAA